MKTEPEILTCECGVGYERRVRQLPIKDIGVFSCEVCDARLEIWSGRTVPMFRRIDLETPDRRRA
jgi:hypothetical protein